MILKMGCSFGPIYICFSTQRGWGWQVQVGHEVALFVALLDSPMFWKVYFFSKWWRTTLVVSSSMSAFLFGQKIATLAKATTISKVSYNSRCVKSKVFCISFISSDLAFIFSRMDLNRPSSSTQRRSTNLYYIPNLGIRIFTLKEEGGSVITFPHWPASYQPPRWYLNKPSNYSCPLIQPPYQK